MLTVAVALDGLAIYSLLVPTQTTPAIAGLNMHDLYLIVPSFAVAASALGIIAVGSSPRALDMTAGALFGLSLTGIAFSASSAFFLAQVAGFVAGANAAASRASRLVANTDGRG